MLLIDCPWCGPRDEIEFRFGGPTGIVRPPGSVDDEVWGRYLFERDNPRGVHHERWLHAYGCGQWFKVIRDTITHEILAACSFEGPAPDSVSARGRPS